MVAGQSTLHAVFLQAERGPLNGRSSHPIGSECNGPTPTGLGLRFRNSDSYGATFGYAFRNYPERRHTHGPAPPLYFAAGLPHLSPAIGPGSLTKSGEVSIQQSVA